MQIKPENRPANWNVIRDQILTRACFRCECCGAPQYAVGQWIEDRFLLARGNGYESQLQYALVHGHAREQADRLNEIEQPAIKYIVIVLTVGFLDHSQKNTDPTNLRAWCQRCDAAYSARSGKPARRSRKKNLELFGETV